MRLCVLSRYDCGTSLVQRLPFAFAGDPFQTINPTGFRWDTTRALFYDEVISELDPQGRSLVKHLNYRELKHNYRSLPHIVEFSNTIQLWRRVLFGHSDVHPQAAFARPIAREVELFLLDKIGPTSALITREGLRGLTNTIILLPCEEFGEDDFVRNDSQLSKVFAESHDNVLSAAAAKGSEFEKVVLVGVARRRIAVATASSSTEAGNVQLPPSPLWLPDANAPIDLTVTVHHLDDGRLQWSWTAPQPELQTETPYFKNLKEPLKFAAGLARELKAWTSGVVAANILENKGQAISDHIPVEFWRDLRRVRKAVGRPPTLLLITNEAYVPWELAYVAPSLDELPTGGQTPPPFLAAQTSMGRWILDENISQPPVAFVDIVDSTAVAAQYDDDAYTVALKHALEERDQLARTWNFAPIRANEDDLSPYLCGSFKKGHLIHFAMHGLSNPTENDQVLILENGKQLPASALAGSHDPSQPPRFAFVFLNACQVGMAGDSFGQAAGFPGLLVRAGVHGFIAPLWGVDDGIACRISQSFYKAALDDFRPLGDILREHRNQYKKAESTTTMAYVYYGHPLLRLRYSKPKA
jgi:hypothetical protein